MRTLWRGAAVAAVTMLVGAGGARADDYPGCVATADTEHAGVVHPEKSTRTAVSIPDSSSPGGSYQGDVFAPTPIPAGKHFPTAVVMHGGGANPCDVWWVSRLLAGRRWIVVDVYRPEGQGGSDPVVAQADAVHAAVDYLRSSGFPYADVASTDKLALIGHSLGSSAVAVAQSDIPDVKTIVALDNLKRWGKQDPGSGEHCTGPRDHETTPTVPALAFASDHHCQGESTLGLSQTGIHKIKETGWRWWRSHMIPAAMLVMKGFKHTSFAGKITDDQITRLQAIMIPWLRSYVRQVRAIPLPRIPPSWLSKRYWSGAFVPSEALDCKNYRQTC